MNFENFSYTLYTAQRWQTYINNNVKFAENNGGEYQTEQDPVIFLNILDVLTSPLTFRYCAHVQAPFFITLLISIVACV